ncbi:MAG: glycosyltransferase family 4 protein [Planctomycetota bacterium]|nr:glycosyltransferase family 4 protein [Planctomycetota bacterium]
MSSQLPPMTFVLPGRNRSGGVRVTVDLGNHLLRRGHRVRLAVGRSGGIRAWGRQIVRRLQAGPRAKDDWVENFAGPVAPFRDLNALAFEPGEVVVAVGSYVVPAVRDLTHDVVRVRFNHGLQRHDPARMNRAWLGEMPTFSVARTSADILMREFGVPHVWIVPNGIDTDAYFETSDVVRDGVGTIFSSNPAKCPDDIVRVMDRIARDLPGVRRYIFSAAERPPALACDEFRRLPPVDEARRLYNRAKVWLLMSRDEGLPGPVLEAMACGAVVVSTDQAGSREVIRPDQNGLFFPVGDIGACIEQVRRVLNDEPLRLRLRAAGGETVRAFSWDAATDRFEAALRDVLRGTTHHAVSLRGEPAMGTSTGQA